MTAPTCIAAGVDVLGSLVAASSGGRLKRSQAAKAGPETTIRPVSTRLGLLANYLGQFWAVAVSLALVPVYIHYLGIEAYGLIGVFATCSPPARSSTVACHRR